MNTNAQSFDNLMFARYIASVMCIADAVGKIYVFFS